MATYIKKKKTSKPSEQNQVWGKANSLLSTKFLGAVARVIMPEKVNKG